MLLDDLLGDFPFVADEHKEHEEADKANILAAILTPLVRPLVDGPTPLFCIEAPIEGSGKGLLAYVIACVTTGGPPAIMTEGGDDDEWRKRLTAALMKTPPILLIDNVRRRLDAGALSATITATVWSDRLMGHSRLVSIPVRTTWLVTANNPTFSGEIGRRVVRIRIDAAVERPWERVEFRIEDLRAWTRRERPRLLWAALTLARAWVVRGRPKGTEVMGSFKDWAATLGGILGVAGVQGLLTNRECVYLQVQTEGEAWVALLNVWWEKYGGQRVGVAQLFDLASQHKLLTDLRAGREERGARTALGMELAQLRDRIIGAYCIRQVGVAPGAGAAMHRLELSMGGFKVEQVPRAPIASADESSHLPEPAFAFRFFLDNSLDHVQNLLCDEAFEFAERLLLKSRSYLSFFVQGTFAENQLSDFLEQGRRRAPQLRPQLFNELKVS